MGDVSGLIILFFLLIAIMLLANVAEKRRLQEQPYEGLALTSYLILGVLYGLAVVVGLLLQLLAVALTIQPTLLQNLPFGNGGNNPFGQLSSLGLLSLGIWLPGLLGLVFLLPGVRRLVASILPIDPASPVHAIALAYTALVAMNLLVTLGIGLNNLTSMLEAQQMQQASTHANDNTLPLLWMQQVLMALFAMFGVGWLVRRGTGETLQRLGIVRPTLYQVALGIGLALLMVPVVLMIEYAGSLFNLGGNPDVEKLTEQMLGPLFHSVIGVITLGAAAALGEETLLRGAVLPRFGLLLTSLLFALLHNNYGFSISTIIVFALGLLLGVVRQRHNTSTSMIIHACYNSLLGLLAYLNISV